MVPKNSEQTFTFEQMSCVLAGGLDSKFTLGTKHFQMMVDVENAKTLSGYEHLFRAAKARAKEIQKGMGNDDTSTPAAKKAKAPAATTPKSTGGKKRARKAASEQANEDAEDEDDDESPSKRTKADARVKEEHKGDLSPTM